MIKLKAGFITFLMCLSGYLSLLSPFWWVKKSINPHHPELVQWDILTAIYFKLDIICQNTLGKTFAWARRKWIVRLERKFSDRHEGEVQELPEFDWKEEPLERFILKYQKAQHPVVLRHFLNQSKDFHSWKLEEFIEKYGEEEVTLTCPVKDGYQGKLKEITIPGVYLHNSEYLMQKYPELYKHMGFELLPTTIARHLGYSGVTQLFAGQKETGTWWHCAGGINIFMMLEGQKKWSFIDPGYSPYLFPKSVGKGKSAYYITDAGVSSKVYKTNYEKLSDEDKQKLNKTQENYLSRSMKEIFDSCPRFEVTLNPGDVLLIPAWWWHDVENITPQTIGVASRWFDKALPTLANSIFSTTTLLNPDFFYTAISGMLEQTLIKEDKSLNLEKRTRPIKEYLTARTRASGLDKYGEISEEVLAYYQRFSAFNDGDK